MRFDVASSCVITHEEGAATSFYRRDHGLFDFEFGLLSASFDAQTHIKANI